MRTRIMYIEDKSGGLTGPCRIGLVRFPKTGSTLYYGDRAFKSLTGAGFKANYFDQVTGASFWISGPRRDGADGLYGRITQPEDVDVDVAEAYWRDIRGRSAAPVATGEGADLRPRAEDRLPFEDRNRVEQKRFQPPEPASTGNRRKAARIERQLDALGRATAGGPSAPPNTARTADR